MSRIDNAPTTDRLDTKEKAGGRRAVVTIGIGNTLEWYDWTIYAIFAPFFASQFFDPGNATASMLATLAVFAAGFLMRPLGGIAFGWLGDRYGRRPALTTAMILVAVGSLIIGISPTHAHVGVLASALLLLARLLQGLAHGGEVTSSYTYLAEIAPARRRGLWSSSLYVFVTIGILAATLLGAVLSATLHKDAMVSWGWRIPFLIGALLGLVALYLRRNLAETSHFRSAQSGRGVSLWQGLREHRGAVLRLGAIQISGSVAYYAWGVAAPSYAISVYHVPATSSLIASVVANLVFIAALVAAGAISDRIGRKPLMLAYLIGFPLIAFPVTWLLGPSAWRLGLAMSIALAFLACATAIVPAYFAELLPSRIRALGIGIPISVAAALFGGTAPYLQMWFAASGAPSLFTVYTIATVLIGLAGVLPSPETRGTELS